MSTPKRHHYLPQKYLRGFAENGLLCLYDRKQKAFRNQTPLNTGLIGHLYTVETSSGQVISDLEDDVYCRVEQDAWAALDAVSRGDRLGEADLESICIFMSFQVIRVPSFMMFADLVAKHVMREETKAAFSNEDTVAKQQYGKSVAELSEQQMADVHSLIESAQSDRYEINVAKGWTVAATLEIEKDVRGRLWNSSWWFAYAPKGSQFITSDKPVTFFNPTPGRFGTVSLMSPDAWIALPISPACALIISPGHRTVDYRKLDRPHTNDLNRQIAYACDRFVISKSDVLLKRIVKRLGKELDYERSWESSAIRFPRSDLR